MTTKKRNPVAKDAPTTGAGVHTSTDKNKRTRQDELDDYADELEEIWYENLIESELYIEEHKDDWNDEG